MKSLGHGFAIRLRQATTTPNEQPVVKREEFEANDTRSMQPRRREVGYGSVSRPGEMGLCRNHSEDSVTILIERCRTEHERRTTLRARLIGERERNNDDIPWLTDHGTPHRLPLSSTRPA